MDPAIAIEGCRNPGSLSPLTPVPSGCESLSTSLPALLGGNVGCRVGVSCIKEIFHGLRERAGPPPSSFLTSSHSVLEICIVRFPGLAHTLAPSFHRWAPHCARQSPKPRECRDGRNLALLSKSSQLLGWARRRAVRPTGRWLSLRDDSEPVRASYLHAKPRGNAHRSTLFFISILALQINRLEKLRLFREIQHRRNLSEGNANHPAVQEGSCPGSHLSPSSRAVGESGL